MRRRIAAIILLFCWALPSFAAPLYETLNGNTPLDTYTVLGRTLVARAGDRINLKDYGATGNAQSVVLTATIGAGSTALSVSAATFSAADVGKVIDVAGAGTGGATLSATVAAYVSPTALTLSTPAVTALSASAEPVTWGTDDSGPIAAAITLMMADVAAHRYACIDAPSGMYLIKATALPPMNGPGCIVGDGVLHTIFKIDPTYSGDVFATSDAWPGGNFSAPTPAVINSQFGGPRFSGFAVWGDASSPNTQNAMMFYDRTQNLVLADVDARFMHGQAYSFGTLKNTTQGFLQESYIHRVRAFNSGIAGGPPVVDINSYGTGATEESGEVKVDILDIYAPNTTGLAIRNNNATTPATSMRFSKLRIEGLEYATTQTGNLLQIGDPTEPGNVNGLVFRETELLNPYTGYSALLTTANSASVMPYSIDFDGTIGSGGVNAGANGLNIAYGRFLNFSLENLAATGTGVVVASSATVGAQITINSVSGVASQWTWNVDATSAASILTAPVVYGNPASPSTQAFALTPHNGSATGGNTLGQGAVDLMCCRVAAYQAATAGQSVLLGGAYNTGGATQGVVVGGNSNQVFGNDSVIIGGVQATDRYRVASQVTSSGGVVPFAIGSSQAARQTMLATGTGAMRLVSGNGANSMNYTPTAYNIMNIPASTALNIEIRLVALDHTNPANSYHWTAPMVAFLRGASGAPTVTMGTGSMAPGSASTGTGSTASVSVTADATNEGLNITFTPPTGTDTWDAFADVVAAEVQ